MTRPPLVRREPLAVALVMVNLGLAVLLVHRRHRSRAALPPGHPDVSVPSKPPSK